MEFWGVELKGDKPVTVVPGPSQVVHLSQAVLVDLKKSDPVLLYAKTGDQKLVIGVLRADNVPQLAFDLVFEKEFELSHNLKNGSVHLSGYKSLMPDEDDEEFSDFSDEEEALTQQNGLVAVPAASKAKPAAPVAKKDNKAKEESDDTDEDSDDDDSGEDGASDEEMADGDEDDDDSEEDESDEEDETPVKSAGGKKRPSSALKTPEAKKAKVVTPQKTDGKKSVGGHVATPHPAKNAKTPKSGGQSACGSCKKTFNSPVALESHTKAKHSAKK